MIKPLFVIVLLNMSFSSFAQDEDEKPKKEFCNEIDNKEALKLYAKGIDKKKYTKPERLGFLSKCISMEPDFAEANFTMGNEIVVHCKLENKSFKPAVPYYYKAIGACPQIHSEPYYYIGFNYYEESKNDSAIKYLEKFIKFKDDDDKKFSKDYEGEIYQAKEMIKYVKKEGEIKKKIVAFEPKVVQGISTPKDEYLAFISPDDKLCFYTRKMPVQSKNQVYASDREVEVFMVSERDKTGLFNNGEPMPWPFNESGDNQGGCTITIDNKKLYFAMMKQEGGNQPNCDIYVSENVDDEWKPIKKISPNVNHAIYWDSQPSISADGNTLFFASDRPGGYGGIDIYYTLRDPQTGTWCVPKNAGPKINTSGDEKTPFIHSDDETLYFSSNGHIGFGGYDIYYIRKNDKKEWMDPENMGYPINTEVDDSGFFVSTDSKTGYFFSYNEGKMQGKGIGKYDLFSFDLYKEARPNETAFLKGDVKNSNGGKVAGGIVEVTNTITKEKTFAVVDSFAGTFMVAVNIKKKDDLLVTVKKNDFAFSSKIVSVKDLTFKSEPKPIQMEMSSAEEGSSFVLNNLYYATNSADLKPESNVVLDAFAEYLKENPTIKIEVQGHTDNVGAAAANEALSANRAFTVKAYLEEKKIDGKRISAKGYGSKKPIAENTTEDGKAKNRRTEFLIISK